MPATVPTDFFGEQRHFAEVKQELLVRYLRAWGDRQWAARLTDSKEPLLFIDLNAAAGQDTQTQQAIHQKLLRCALRRNGLPEALRFYFGDSARPELTRLAQEAEQLPVYGEFAKQPAFLHEAENRRLLGEMLSAGPPALVFMDPFSHGYAQETLLKAFTTAQTDMFLLLDPGNLRKAVAGKKVSQAMSALLGARLQQISAFCRKEKEKGRQEVYILQHLQGLLREQNLYTLLFRINAPGTDNASHYLLFASADAAAYHSFKELLLPYTAYQPDGVPLFVSSQGPQHQLALFEHRPAHTVAKLADALADSTAQYKFKPVEKIYEWHSLNTPYTLDNYLAALEHLRDQGKVQLLNGKTMQTVRKVSPTSIVKYIPQPQPA